MNYYAEDNSPRRMAVIVATIYFVVTGAAMYFVSFDFTREKPSADTLYVIELEPEPVAVAERPVPANDDVPHTHTVPAPVQTADNAAGSDEKVQTVNPRALFRMNDSGTDDPEPAGNPKAEESDAERSHGTGTGTDPLAGSLDAGLQGRGLVGSLPKPAYTVDAVGKVVIEVTVDASGRVTKASFRALGSTTNNTTLVEAARQAALKARFAESKDFVQSGTITYIFRMQR
ncbi:MAG: TonB family protein [Alistipes sp.]|nr:TonB family protein [Alistipes sp.]